MNHVLDRELKECPFCGGSPRISFGNEFVYIGGSTQDVKIDCESCPVEMSQSYDTYSNVIENYTTAIIQLSDKWNSRIYNAATSTYLKKARLEALATEALTIPAAGNTDICYETMIEMTNIVLHLTNHIDVR